MTVYAAPLSVGNTMRMCETDDEEECTGHFKIVLYLLRRRTEIVKSLYSYLVPFDKVTVLHAHIMDTKKAFQKLVPAVIVISTACILAL